MKRIYFMLLILAGIFVSASCTKQESVVFHDADSILKNANLPATMIVIDPAGPMYDTENLMAAFAQAKESGPGSIVQLAEGEFYLDKIDIYDFRGTFKGSGKDKTVIHTVPGGIDIGITSPYIETNPFFIEFHGGDITVSDMSFEILDNNPAQAFDCWNGEIVTFLAAIIRVSGSSPENNTADSKFQNLRFIGKLVNLFAFTPYNVDNCIELGGGNATYPLGGKHVIQNCEFNTSETGIITLGLTKGNLTVGGNPEQGNSFANENTGFGFMAGANMNVKVSNNKMEAIQSLAGIFIDQEDIPADFNDGVVLDACDILIQNNVIELAGPNPDAIAIYDIAGYLDPAKQSKFHIQGNLLKLSGGYQSAINGCCIVNANVLQNIISGNSVLGFYIWGISTGCEFKFNDFSQFNPDWLMDIWLTQDTYDNKVICETDKTSVYDASGLNVIKGPAEIGKVVDIASDEFVKIKQHSLK